MSKLAGYRKLVKELIRAQRELELSTSPVRGPGSVENRFGTFWGESLFRRVCGLFEEVVKNAPDEDEALSSRYSFAALLRDGMRWDEAARECELLSSLKPERKHVYLSLLALIEARRGNSQEAMSLAAIVNSVPNNRHFRVQEDELLHEIELGKKPL